MKRFSSALFVLGISCAYLHGEIVLEDNFDGYADQAAFDAVWSVLPGTTAGVTYENVKLSQVQAHSPSNSALVPAAPTGTLTLQRSSRDFTTTSLLGVGDQIVYSFDFYDTNYSAAAYREYAELRSSGFSSSTNQLLAIGLNNNQTTAANGGNLYMARILGYDPLTGDGEVGGTSGSFFKLNDVPGVALRTSGWNNLKVSISTDDFLSNDFRFYVNGVLAETVDNVGAGGQIRSYERAILGSALTNLNNAAYFDNVLVQYIPFATPTNNPDFNGNLVVDAADYVLWRNYIGLTGTATQSQGDANGDMSVDGADYDLWRANFGNTLGSGSGLGPAVVPEPATVLLLIPGVIMIALGRRRRLK